MPQLGQGNQVPAQRPERSATRRRRADRYLDSPLEERVRAPLASRRTAADLTAVCVPRHTKGAVPAFLFGGRCPYRLFDADTCRFAAAGFTTVTVVNGRQVTLRGASLAGQAANGFAEG